MVECDFCGKEFEMALRHCVALPRPSDPQELVAVMWACPTCGIKEKLPTASALGKAVEEGRPVDGRIYHWITV